MKLKEIFDHWYTEAKPAQGPNFLETDVQRLEVKKTNHLTMTFWLEYFPDNRSEAQKQMHPAKSVFQVFREWREAACRAGKYFTVEDHLFHDHGGKMEFVLKLKHTPERSENEWREELKAMTADEPEPVLVGDSTVDDGQVDETE